MTKVRLEAVSKNPPAGAASLLIELGAGENGFGGTEFGLGELNLPEFLCSVMSETEVKNIPETRVQQTTFWIVGERNRTAGMLRMRHYLNDYTRLYGGHIGYYIRPAARGKGIATEALRLALKEIAKVGVNRVLLTARPDNTASIKVIENNGGSLHGRAPQSSDADATNHYWIDIDAPVFEK